MRTMYDGGAANLSRKLFLEVPINRKISIGEYTFRCWSRKLASELNPDKPIGIFSDSQSGTLSPDAVKPP